jgi:eukaryotic-like serine/threonine-protein kinase
MSALQSPDRKTFLANLRQSKLLTAAQLTGVLRVLPATARGQDVARALVKKELLTRFQAERLLAGRNTGFVLGRYRILDQLGRGGMGRVFKAEHRTMKRLVALKVLAPKLLQSERARTLFLREVQAAAQIVHPNVVAAFDANEEKGHYFLVLEYVDGPNLDQLVREQGPLPVGLACDYIKQTANGLQAAHALGMVHRDIKPSNLLVQRRTPHEHSPGLLKISDFGLARLNAPPSGAAADHAGTILTKQNTVMGTPDFLSPEQARDLHRADIRSDLYSLGCTFYYLLTGQVPFPGGTALEKLIRHSAEEPAPLADCRPDVPVAVAAIVRRLLCKAPTERYQTPRELAEALEPYAVGGPTPWASPPPSGMDLDTATMRVSEPTSSTANILEGNSADDWSALTSTSSPDPAPTPLNTPDRRRSRPTRRWFRTQRRTILMCLTGVAVALLAVLAVVMALLP